MFWRKICRFVCKGNDEFTPDRFLSLAFCRALHKMVRILCLFSGQIFLHLTDFGIDVEALGGGVAGVPDFSLKELIGRSGGVPDGSEAFAQFAHSRAVKVDVFVDIADENLQSFLREQDAAFIQKNKSFLLPDGKQKFIYGRESL